MLTPSEIEKLWDTARFVDGGESPHKVFAAAIAGPLLERIAALKAENHNLNWALGTEGFDQMATPEDQAAHDEGLERVAESIAKMKARKERHDRLVPDGWRRVAELLLSNSKYQSNSGAMRCIDCDAIREHKDGCVVKLASDMLSAAPAAPEQQEPGDCSECGGVLGHSRMCSKFPGYGGWVAQAPNAQQADPMCRIAKVKLADLIERGHSVCGVMIEKTHSDGKLTRGAVSNGGMVIWWHPESMEAAHSGEQQAEAQEPCAWRFRLLYGADGMEKRVGDWRHVGHPPQPGKDVEIEQLFPRPQPAQLLALSREEALALPVMPMMKLAELVEIVQSALAAKNKARLV